MPKYITSSPSRALVTGGAGFIGSHLVDRLIADGHEVVVVDSQCNGGLNNLAHLSSNAKLTVHVHDVNETPVVRELMNGVDWVFHLAALADIVPSIETPAAYHRANVDGTASVLEAARSAGVRRFIYAASSSCYGVPDAFPTPETAEIRPLYPYALTKFVGELYVLHWSAVYGLPCVSLRLFNVFGPRSRTVGTYGAVFGVFLAQKLAGRPYTVVGDGSQTRDFTFVTDVVDAFVRAAESSVSGEVFNVGSGGTYSVNQLASLLGGDVVHIPKRPGEPDCTFADTVKIRSVLNWQAQVPFERGVEIVKQHIDLWRDAPVWDEHSIAAATRTWFDALGSVGHGAEQ